MNVIFITQDDPFYIPLFFKTLFRKWDKRAFHLQTIVVLPPFHESLTRLIRRMFSFYGYTDFLKQGFRYARIKILDKLPWCNYSLKSLAKERKIPLKKIKNVNDANFIIGIKNMKPDVIISIACPQVFSQDLLKVCKWCINVHSAKLPKYRGMMPNFWAMYHGDKTAGITIHTMDEKIDKGKIILQREIEILPDDTLDSLITRSKIVGAELILEVLKKIKEGTVELKDYGGRGSYFSFPSKKEVMEFKKRGGKLI